jgi:hypothetical protein
MKYTIVIVFNDGHTEEYQSTKIYFHSGLGGIDIFDDSNETPFFPDSEENVKEIIIILNK